MDKKTLITFQGESCMEEEESIDEGISLPLQEEDIQPSSQEELRQPSLEEGQHFSQSLCLGEVKMRQPTTSPGVNIIPSSQQRESPIQQQGESLEDSDIQFFMRMTPPASPSPPPQQHQGEDKVIRIIPTAKQEEKAVEMTTPPPESPQQQLEDKIIRMIATAKQEKVIETTTPPKSPQQQQDEDKRMIAAVKQEEKAVETTPPPKSPQQEETQSPKSCTPPEYLKTTKSYYNSLDEFEEEEYDQEPPRKRVKREFYSYHPYINALVLKNDINQYDISEDTYNDGCSLHNIDMIFKILITLTEKGELISESNNLEDILKSQDQLLRFSKQYIKESLNMIQGHDLPDDDYGFLKKFRCYNDNRSKLSKLNVWFFTDDYYVYVDKITEEYVKVGLVTRDGGYTSNRPLPLFKSCEIVGAKHIFCDYCCRYSIPIRYFMTDDNMTNLFSH